MFRLFLLLPVFLTDCAVVTQGSNTFNEDTYIIADLPEYDLSVYGVFDGHGGTGASAFIRDRFVETLRIFLETSGDVGSALALALKQVDMKYWSENPGQAWEMGACALVIAVTSKEIVVANLGDSHAILVTQEGWTPLNRLLNAASKEEQDRILAAHPSTIITCNPAHQKACYIWMEDRGLQPTRTIGDKFFYPVITATAEISKFDLPKLGGRIVLATDGLWDEVPTDAVAHMALKGEPLDAAQALLKAGQENAANRANIDVSDLISRLGMGSRGLIDDTTILVFDIKVG